MSHKNAATRKIKKAAWLAKNKGNQRSLTCALTAGSDLFNVQPIRLSWRKSIRKLIAEFDRMTYNESKRTVNKGCDKQC